MTSCDRPPSGFLAHEVQASVLCSLVQSKRVNGPPSLPESTLAKKQRL